MKSINILLAGSAAIAGLLLLPSCDKELEQQLPQQTDYSNSSTVQVYNAMVGSNRGYLYMDGKPLNGSTIGYGNNFPLSVSGATTGPANGFLVPAGQRSFVFRDTAAVTTQVPLSFAENFQANRSYTVFLYDTSTSPKQITIPTELTVPQDTTARVRFANFVYSAVGTPLPVDVYSVKKKANVFTNVAKTQVTDFIPYASASNDTLMVRTAGTTTLLLQLNGFNPTQKRSYTLVYRGGVTKSLTPFSNR